MSKRMAHLWALMSGIAVAAAAANVTHALGYGSLVGVPLGGVAIAILSVYIEVNDV